MKVVEFWTVVGAVGDGVEVAVVAVALAVEIGDVGVTAEPPPPLEIIVAIVEAFLVGLAEE